MKKTTWVIHTVGACGLAAVLGSSTLVAQGPNPPGPGNPGGPLIGLTQQQMQQFQQGVQEFTQNENPQTGLGPVFNGVSCAQCHNAGALGGASPNLGISVVTRIGAMVNGQYSDLQNVGGPLIQARSLREILGPQYPIGREVVPPQAQFVSRRITTPVFGMGLIEAIPAATILSRSNVPQGGGIMGVANIVFNPDTGLAEVGRFGWKAQSPSIHAFAGDAYLNEMGITNPSFPAENLPQGQNIPPGGDPRPDDPESGDGAVEALSNFMRLSAFPAALPGTRNSEFGRRIFERIQCASCHVPSMRTGFSPIAAISNKDVPLYSDLLLHRMGAALADGIRQGQAQGDQWRTPPLWGLRLRPFLLHDGRATSIEEAVRAHGGEAARSRTQFEQLNHLEKIQIMEFLRRL
jgi:CxxC motif-containing protein (DUF1111 family)